MPFYDKSNDRTNFVLGWMEDAKPAIAVYSKAYRESAERLAGRLIRARRFSDYQAYPVVYLYRHALELSLKHVIYRCVILAALRVADDVEHRLQNDHRLDALAATAMRGLSVLYPHDTLIAELRPICFETCADLSAVDPHSYAFRYPIRRDGRPSTDQLTMNLRDFANRMSWVLEQLDTILFALSAEIDVSEDAMALALGIR